MGYAMSNEGTKIPKAFKGKAPVKKPVMPMPKIKRPVKKGNRCAF
jgi:hypothetical protein